MFQAKQIGTNEALGLSSVVVVLLIPSLIWILRDQTVWPWDQAWYGELTLHLAHSALDGPLPWLKAMFSGVTSKPPLLEWSGQTFVPFARILGSYERALLLVNLTAAAATLALVFWTVRHLAGTQVAALTAVLACGGASLFIGMTHQFFVEPAQSLTIAGLMRVSLEARSRKTVGLGLCMTVCIALAFLAKTTSIGFIIPFVLYVLFALLVRPSSLPSAFGLRSCLLVAATSLLTVSTLAWYVTNWDSVLVHIKNSTVADVALHYGSVGTFPSKLNFWVSALLYAMTPWSWLGYAWGLLIAAALAVAIGRVVRLPWRRWPAECVASGTLFTICLAGTVVAGIIAYASQINEETRFLSPMIPLVSVLIGWSLSVLGQKWVTLPAIMLTVANAVAGHLHAHGIIALPPQTSAWLKPYRIEPASVERLDRAVRLSCDPRGLQRYSIVGVEMPDFNANSAAFFSEKQKGAVGYRCNYTSLGYAETDLERAWKRLYDLDAEYFVTLQPDNVPADPRDFLNQVAKPVALRIAASPDWRRITGAFEAAQVFQRRR